MRIRSEILVFLFWTLSGVCATKGFKNETIECVFREYDKCYLAISSLGADFTARYDETEMQINATCRTEMQTRQCIANIPHACNTFSGWNPNRIIDTVHNLCTKNKTEHKNFLNSSICYNQNLSRRQNCVNKYSYGSKTDVKSLCCSNRDTLECLKEELRNTCPRNYTEFQNHLMEVYRSHHFAVCGHYYRICNGASSFVISAGFIMFLIMLVLIQK
ncbi:uncharacterized protein LOC129961702 [Argiope bruennichi]|uniref:uncharacterized protein LOC129961702 n=1 Tax=Argiope bruennichi TaxID=94029 RepID=UPI0024952C65|nr:uncharacterized protein LOC129961702 [Argiope bruennichi]